MTFGKETAAGLEEAENLSGEEKLKREAEDIRMNAYTNWAQYQ